MLLAAVLPTAAVARDTNGDDAGVNNGPVLWQEKEAPAYVPVARDLGDTWRSVTMPTFDTVKNMLAENGSIPLNATPEQIDTIVAQWFAKARKDAYTGPDPLAFRNLEKREKALLNGQSTKDISLPTPPKDVMG
ncbi:MAG: hypothetical protein ACK2U9_16170, partial [Anaerolineae bacterium]